MIVSGKSVENEFDFILKARLPTISGVAVYGAGAENLALCIMMVDQYRFRYYF